MAETTAVPGDPDPATDPGPQDAVPPWHPRNAYDEHPPGPAALYEPPVPVTAPAPAPVPDPAPAPVPESVPDAQVPPLPPVPSTGWTVTGMPAMGGPAAQAAAPAPAPQPPFGGPGATPAHGVPAAQGIPAQGVPAPVAPPVTNGLGTAPRGRILVVEGGYGGSGRRTWGRGGSAQAPVLSAMLAAVSPQVLLAADAVDAVHLPGASDPHTVIAHLRAAARHPGPLLVHLGGHLLADKRSGQLHLTLRDSKPGSVRQDGLAWQLVAAELRHRPADWQTLVIADLSADQSAWPLLQGAAAPLTDGLPLWAVVSPDPEQIGTFTRALIEALHGGRPGGEAVLAPEQLRQQVYSVLRPDVVVLATHAPDRPFFRNTARRGDGSVADPAPYEGQAAVPPRPAAPEEAPWGDLPPQDAVPHEAVPRPRTAVTLDKPGAAVDPSGPAPEDGPAAGTGAEDFADPSGAAPADDRVDLLKAGVPPTPPPAPRPVDLLKSYAWQAPADAAADAEATSEPPVQDARVDEPPAEAPEVQAGADAEEDTGGEEAREAAGLPVPADAVPGPGSVPDAAPEAVVEPGAAGAGSAEPTEPTEPAREPEAVPVPVPVPAPEPLQPRADYREVIGRIVRSAEAGDHAAATDLAFALELEAIGEHGSVSAPVLQVRQVRAHVCRLAGRTAEAADIYREVALTLLRAQGPEHPETQQAATNAEACWRAIPDRAEALRIAPEIIELRAYLPGPDGRKLRAAERHLAHLAAAQPDHA
ncbi:hypothetical protein [Kitasatospora sp. NBC_00458]|uniref:hypothetical protein n=1 Tax=Kitasatospora sp. NBC_00458 TaxID=2903568 RepID=UPI002E18E8CF